MNDETSEPTEQAPLADGSYVDTHDADAGDEHHGIGGVRGGIAIALVGALMLVVGMLSTTSSHGGNAECPDGTVLVAKFEYSGGKYKFEKPSGNQNVVTISDANAKGGVWTSTTPISAIIVKGGPGSKTTTLTPPQTSGTFSNKDLPEVGRGNTPDISNLQFCGPKTPVTTTTAKPTTTTTVKPTTTTSTTVYPTTTSSTTSSTTTPSTTSSTTPNTSSTSSSTTSSTTSTIVSGSGSSGGTVAPTPTPGSAGTAGTRVVSVVLAAASPTV